MRVLVCPHQLGMYGEAGHWQLLDETTAGQFLDAGWYGRGGAGTQDLARSLGALSDSPALRQRLGRFGRELVADRYDLDRAADRLAALYVDTALGRYTRATLIRSLVRSAATSARYYTSKRFGSVVGREQRVREGAIE